MVRNQYKTLKLNNVFIAFSTVPSNKYDKWSVPLIRGGRCTISLQFDQTISTDLLQQMHVLSISPALLTVDYNRKVLISYTTG